MRIVALISMLVLGACGGSSDEPASSGSAGAEQPAETCEGYTRGQSCVDDAAFSQCQQMSAQCPGEVQVMESCPLQFACPSAAAPATCNGHTVDEACMNDAAFAACQQAEAQCPGQVLEAESCPLQFRCP